MQENRTQGNRNYKNMNLAKKNLTVIPRVGLDSTGCIQGSGQSGSDKICRVAAYCRVSTRLEEQQNSLANQISHYHDIAVANPHYELKIYAEKGVSGTGTKGRKAFQEMIADCMNGKIDIVITKSVSRFSRNTADNLVYIRMLRDKGIPVIFEENNINTMGAKSELILTLMAVMAQEESRDTSENVAWAIRKGFRNGVPRLNTIFCMGYDKDPDGKLVINREQAAIVRKIYAEYLQGWSEWDIAHRLNERGVCGVHGKPAWNRCTIAEMLQNELYKGDVRMQKVYTKDFLTHRKAANRGELEQYYLTNDHPAIIPSEEWEAVQLEIRRRRKYCEEHGIFSLCIYKHGNAFIGKVLCAECGGRYCIKSWPDKPHYWMCANREKRNGKTCENDNLQDVVLRSAFVTAWKDIVEQRDSMLARWQEMILHGNPLQRLRAHQMMEQTEAHFDGALFELARILLDHVCVGRGNEMTFYFLDGSSRRVKDGRISD